ncbi:MAG: hypothetical protein K2L59_09540 [Muribaculaceae bacterium]|nr:hypothetical protein [Muribaculaceae bacterium]
MDTVCIISFGNSTKYRLALGSRGGELADIKAVVREYLVDRFPDLSDLDFYDRMTVVPVNAGDEEKYRNYREFDDSSVREIESVLSREVEDSEDVRGLNSNEPWGSETPEV